MFQNFISTKTFHWPPSFHASISYWKWDAHSPRWGIWLGIAGYAPVTLNSHPGAFKSRLGTYVHHANLFTYYDLPAAWQLDIRHLPTAGDSGSISAKDFISENITTSSIFACRISWMGWNQGLQSIVPKRKITYTSFTTFFWLHLLQTD